MKDQKINDAVSFLSTLENAKKEGGHFKENSNTDDVKVETIIQYLDKSKEILLRFKEIDNDENGTPKGLKKWFRRFIGHIVKAIGDFLSDLGDRMIKDNS